MEIRLSNKLSLVIAPNSDNSSRRLRSTALKRTLNYQSVFFVGAFFLTFRRKDIRSTHITQSRQCTLRARSCLLIWHASMESCMITRPRLQSSLTQCLSNNQERFQSGKEDLNQEVWSATLAQARVKWALHHKSKS